MAWRRRVGRYSRKSGFECFDSTVFLEKRIGLDARSVSVALEDVK